VGIDSNDNSNRRRQADIWQVMQTHKRPRPECAFGHLHEVNNNGVVTYVYGNNDLNQIVGQGFDFNTRRWVGYIGDLPITKSR